LSGLGPREMAEVLSVQAAEMLRIWRLARHSAHPETLPGLSDGALESFFDALGPLLARGAAPGEVGDALAGTVRIPQGGADAALADEWEMARKVLRAACESLGATEAVSGWLDDAASASREAVLRAAGGNPDAPPRLVRLKVFSAMTLRPRTV
jgi:hypothetical protein